MTKLNLVEFGDQLLRTGDLDPVYVAVDNAALDRATLARLCIAYWCFYHLGAAAKLAEISKPAAFWKAMQAAARNLDKPDGTKPWPRGAERRHFRGEQAIAAMAELEFKYGKFKYAEDMLAQFVGAGSEQPMTFKSVSASVKSHRGFGDWIAFKVADMCERVLDYDVDFGDCHLGIYKDPRQGAAVAYLSAMGARYMIGDVELPLWDYPITDAQLAETVERYVKYWRKRKFKALPSRKRLVNVQEIETIFCKYKSHLKGRYPVGKDTSEIRHGLTGWGDLAATLQKGLPRG